jgi:hypothetical protein
LGFLISKQSTRLRGKVSSGNPKKQTATAATTLFVAVFFCRCRSTVHGDMQCLLCWCEDPMQLDASACNGASCAGARRVIRKESDCREDAAEFQNNN